MRGLFLLGCGLLLLESSCSGSTSRSSSPPAEAGSGGRSNEKLPGTTMTGSGGDFAGASTSAGGSADAAGQAGAPDTAGSGGEAGAPVEVEADCGCASSSLGWWGLGGRRPTKHESFIDPCVSFQHAISDSEDFTLSSCKSQLVGGCDVSLGVHELNAALLHPDVQAALAAAPVFYGADMRDSDGTVTHVEIDEKVIEIGSWCEDPGCAIPPGVEELGILLGIITEHELGSGCILEP